jgi:hypothetical protein
MDLGGKAKGDFPSIALPDMYGTYQAYMGSSWRTRLLEAICTKRTGRLLHSDGTDLNTPTSVRNFLTAELILGQGTSDEPIVCCTTADFGILFDSHSDEAGVGIQDEEDYHWMASTSNPDFKLKLSADGLVVKAIRAYLETARPKLLGQTGGAESIEPGTDLLFPTCGAGQLRNLLPSLNLLLKFAGTMPKGQGLSRNFLQKLRADLLREKEILAILRSSLSAEPSLSSGARLPS